MTPMEQDAILNTLSRALTPATIQQISSSIGASPTATSQAVNLALPALLGGLSRNASNPQGAQDLDRALNAHDGGILDKLAAANREKLDWKHSIVDLMKLVGMDSSLTARKELADDLNYTGDKSDSAKMNMWLHKEVMKKLAANGGKVPADLLK